MHFVSLLTENLHMELVFDVKSGYFTLASTAMFLSEHLH